MKKSEEVLMDGVQGALDQARVGISRLLGVSIDRLEFNGFIRQGYAYECYFTNKDTLRDDKPEKFIATVVRDVEDFNKYTLHGTARI